MTYQNTFVFISVICAQLLPKCYGAALRSQPVPKDTRGTVVNAISGVVSVVSPSSCLGDLMMTGYSNDLYGEDDYRFQPHCYNSGAANRLECFPSSAIATTPRGPVSMYELKIGDEVMTYNQKLQSSVFEPVLYFLHRDETRLGTDWYHVRHSGGRLTLSSTHLVMRPDGSSVSALSLRAGDKLVVMTEGAAAEQTVHSVEKAADRFGIYAPMTASGTLIVDGVLVSSFAVPAQLRLLEGVCHTLLRWASLPLVKAAQSPVAVGVMDRMSAVLSKYSLGNEMNVLKTNGHFQVLFSVVERLHDWVGPMAK